MRRHWTIAAEIALLVAGFLAIWKIAGHGEMPDVSPAAPSAVSDSVRHGKPTLPWQKQWVAETNSAILGAPAIGDAVYVCTQAGEILALALADGARQWVYRAAGPISATPVVRNGWLLVGDEAGVFHAIDATGRCLWQSQAEDKITGCAAIADGLVFFGSYDHKVYAVRLANGERVWAADTGERVDPGCATGAGMVFAVNCGGGFLAMAAASGEEVFRLEIQEPLAAMPIYDAGRVFCSSMNGRVMAVDINKRALVWDTGERYQGACRAAAAIKGDRLVLLGWQGALRCLAAADGAELWQREIGGESRCASLIMGEAVLCGGADGVLRLLALADGKELWRCLIGSAISGMAAQDSRLLVATAADGSVHCFRPAPQPAASGE